MPTRKEHHSDYFQSSKVGWAECSDAHALGTTINSIHQTAMAHYRRSFIPGGRFFFTLVTNGRRPLFADSKNIELLRSAFRTVMADRPFVIEAMVVLPDHLHAIWRLPEGDADFSSRWRLIKYRFSLSCETGGQQRLSLARKREKGIWQRRFWEHSLRDDEDVRRHVEYIHYNPVKHGYCRQPADWEFSSFRRFVDAGFYPLDWAGVDPVGLIEVAGE